MHLSRGGIKTSPFLDNSTTGFFEIHLVKLLKIITENKNILIQTCDQHLFIFNFNFTFIVKKNFNYLHIRSFYLEHVGSYKWILFSYFARWWRFLLSFVTSPLHSLSSLRTLQRSLSARKLLQLSDEYKLVKLYKWC